MSPADEEWLALGRKLRKKNGDLYRAYVVVLHQLVKLCEMEEAIDELRETEVQS